MYDKALPIPTQTDPINKMEHKSTSSQEVKHSSVSLPIFFLIKRILLEFVMTTNLKFQTQTEPLEAMATPVKVDEQKLINSMRTLSVLMENEVKIGTTNAFKFQN